MSDTPVMIDIYTSKFSPTLPINLTIADKARLMNINSARARAGFSFCHTFLNNILQQRLNIEIKDLEFSYNPHSKPYLEEQLFNSSELYFSLTHSGDYVAVAISKSIEIGLDLEDITKRKVETCKKLAKRFFTEAEQHYINNGLQINDFNMEKFLQIWTLKEAYLKAIGTGINISLKSINFQVTSDSIQLTDSNLSSSTRYTFYSKIFNDFTLSLAAKTPLKLDLCLHEKI